MRFYLHLILFVIINAISYAQINENTPFSLINTVRVSYWDEDPPPNFGVEYSYYKTDTELIFLDEEEISVNSYNWNSTESRVTDQTFNEYFIYNYLDENSGTFVYDGVHTGTFVSYDASLDLDSNGISDGEQIEAGILLNINHKLSPNLSNMAPSDSDTDNDGVSDDVEIIENTNPNDSNDFNSLSIGLVGYYSFWGNANDGSGYSNHGVISNATLAVDRFGMPESSFYFGGASYIELGNVPQILDQDYYTQSAWIKTNSNDSSWKINPVITKRNDIFDAWLTLGIGENDNYSDQNTKGKASLIDDRNNYKNEITSNNQINDNNWHHLVSVRDGSTFKLFVNGDLVADSSLGSHTYNNNSFYIGYAPAWNQYFKGFIDDVRIYNRALSDSEVSLLYNTELIQINFPDTDGDGVNDLEDEFPDDPSETTDTDDDGVGDNADAFPSDPSETVDSDSDGVGDNVDTFPSIPTQDIINDVISNPTLYKLYSTDDIKDLRPGSTIIEVSGNQATVHLQMEESSDLQTWEDTGTPATMTFPADTDTKFFRFKMAEQVRQLDSGGGFFILNFRLFSLKDCVSLMCPHSLMDRTAVSKL